MSASPTGHQPKPLMKVPEVADLFDVDHETVRVWARTGKLRSRKNPGGRVLVFVRSEVYALLEGPDDPGSPHEHAPAGLTPAHEERRAGDSSTDSPQPSSLTDQSSEGTTS